MSGWKLTSKVPGADRLHVNRNVRRRLHDSPVGVHSIQTNSAPATLDSDVSAVQNVTSEHGLASSPVKRQRSDRSLFTSHGQPIVFMLTHLQASNGQPLLPTVAGKRPRLSTASSSATGDKDDVKDLSDLQQSIELHGGVIVSEVDQHLAMLASSSPMIVVLSLQPHRTVKHAFTLARGIPPLPPQWVYECIKAQKLVSIGAFALPLGAPSAGITGTHVSEVKRSYFICMTSNC